MPSDRIPHGMLLMGSLWPKAGSVTDTLFVVSSVTKASS